MVTVSESTDLEFFFTFWAQYTRFFCLFFKVLLINALVFIETCLPRTQPTTLWVRKKKKNSLLSLHFHWGEKSYSYENRRKDPVSSILSFYWESFRKEKNNLLWTRKLNSNMCLYAKSGKKRKTKQNKAKKPKKQKWVFYSIIYSMKTGNRRKSRQKVMKDKSSRIGKSGKGCWEWRKH